MRILLLEDDRETATALERGLAREGHEVLVALGVAQALKLVAAEVFDVAILDIMVPGGSGYDVLKQIRQDGLRTRVLMLTARGSVRDRVEGLDSGADDYLVKPFSFVELSARLRALRRREDVTELQVGDLELLLTKHVALVRGERLDLTPTEFGILSTLVRAQGETVSRAQLLREVWSYDFDPGTNLVDVHVNRLRRKLETVELTGLIRTVRSRGYAAA
ncbi:MAG: response regulator transcription factor [Deltaproteobacteria bacterium]|nr:response regulator transcription factor [Deltaproteobacteria bacterium]MBW2446794.1 response regulator transcription factor [Deltaproteobacteria bacterium]